MFPSSVAFAIPRWLADIVDLIRWGHQPSEHGGTLSPQDWASLVASFVAAGATVVLAILTASYVRLTGRMVREMRAAREPAVFLDFEHFQRTANLCIGNSGGTPAINVRFSLEDWGSWESDFIAPDRLTALREGIAYLPPGRVLKYELSRVGWNKERAAGSAIRILARWENEQGEEFRRDVNFDFSHYFEVQFASFNDPIDHVSRAIRDLTDVIKKRFPEGDK